MMHIEIAARQLAGCTDFVPCPARLHLGSQNAEGVDVLSFALPAAWAGKSVALHIERADGTPQSPLLLDGQGQVDVDRRLTAARAGRWMLTATDGDGYTAYTQPGCFDTGETLPTDSVGEPPSPSLYEQFVAQVLGSAGDAVMQLQQLMKKLLEPYVKTAPVDLAPGGLNLFLVLGVNGVGKTTSIAKLGAWYRDRGKRVLFAAADTFRAAAVDQLDIHAERLGMRIVKQSTGSDPGAVVYDALSSAIAHNDDLVLADTAGRMHNKENLMKELQKIDKIIDKRGIPAERYRKLLVIDATTGQNGLSQAMLFNSAVRLDGVILTKYDSAAKGGALVQIGQQLGLPILFVGTGEKYTDIHPFDKDEFLDALVGIGE